MPDLPPASSTAAPTSLLLGGHAPDPNASDPNAPGVDPARAADVVMPHLGVTVRHLLALGCWFIALVVVVMLFAPIKSLVLGLLATGAVASALHPLMRYVPGPRGLRAVIVGLLPVVLLALVVGLGYLLLAKPIAEQARQLPQARDAIDGTLARWSDNVGLPEPIKVTDLATRAGDALTGGGAGRLFATTTQALGGALVGLAFVFFGSMYLLADDPQKLVTPITKLMPERRREPLRAAFRSVVPQLRAWLIGVMFSMSVVGLTSAVGYWLVGLKMAIPLGLLTGLAEIIPTFGPSMAFVVGLVFAAGQGGGAIAGVLVVYCVVQVIESYVLTPLVMNRAVEMPPLVTLFTIVLWGGVFGAAGLLLAIPINVVLWALVDHLVIRQPTHAIVAPSGE